MTARRWLAPRRLFACGALLCAILIAVALYMQHALGLEPCPLCIFQRVFVIALGAVMLVAAAHAPGALGLRVYGALVALVALLGVGVAGRHVWLQSLPEDRIPECGPGLGYILDAFPPVEAVEMILRGSGECAEVQWSFAGLTIPGWTLVVFVGITVFGLWLALFPRRAAAAGTESAGTVAS